MKDSKVIFGKCGHMLGWKQINSLRLYRIGSRWEWDAPGCKEANVQTASPINSLRQTAGQPGYVGLCKMCGFSKKCITWFPICLAVPCFEEKQLASHRRLQEFVLRGPYCNNVGICVEAWLTFQTPSKELGNRCVVSGIAEFRRIRRMPRSCSSGWLFHTFFIFHIFHHIMG